MSRGPDAGPRVRFAPSPTGFLHVGGARTALFNWLFARGRGGAFVLRIEDTDRERSSEAMTRAIVDGLAWLGLDPDEEPVHQADGLERHRRDARRLLASGAAYRCFCTQEELEARRAAARARGEEYAYEGRCQEIDPGEAEAREAAGESFALRFAVPEGRTSWDDLVHGDTGFDHEHLEDFVLLRSDGTPVYNLAVVSDDVAMGITHVLRGDDHISNTPKQILIYRALGEALPVFGHLPMILGTDGKRLSKRHGALAVEAYREEGLLPEAMVNFLALLGWNPGDEREVMDREDLVAAFEVQRIQVKSAVFDPEKLLWLNGQHIARAAPERLADRVTEVLVDEHGIAPERLSRERERFLDVLALTKERGRTIPELAGQVAPFFREQIEYEAEAVARFWRRPEEAARALRALEGTFREVPAWEPEVLEEKLRARAEAMEVGAGKLIHPLRVALMGQGVSPGIFRVLELMGRERTLRRIETALGWLDARAGAEA